MPTSRNPAAPSAALVHALNAVPSVLWSGLALVPLSVFCYQHMARPWLWALLGVSLLGYLVPQAWFRHWQLSRSAAVYRRLGVPVVGRFTQHGTLVNTLLRRRYPQYRHVPHRRAVRALVANSYHMERFHVVLLVFFGLVSLYALAHGYFGWAALLLLTNVGYNLYPVWLQQYLRLRAPTVGGPAGPR
ncbi:glycosyl-4,4'-diaponeurosporenoate acyltransferase CrtO family protein [Hymenobacter chitinivorans]|uniref:Glycosyl-4,4'-diaponeurosporenoate acyltransferase n=1 Tax=Hymenobacter chitinivorans DSM 11115 TaxID=1121954 RepID=A0A2M9B4P6_9BACT|nr:hypothetical protein [Hymenobacter chitinivorans]PJJ52903.1 hypothetical protein CLV45_3560 [Hymenobacter chitinivorans DSM 11115]